MSLFLASVTSLQEAQMALELGVDVIDLKDPEQGALGALPVAAINQIARFVAGRRPVSATVGDLPMQPQALLHAVEMTAAVGVDMVKVGFFPATTQRICLQALQQVTKRGIKLIAVVFADQPVSLDVLADFSAAGFYGVMLDTASKSGKGLTDVLPLPVIADFVAQGKQLGLLVGLAGSLGVADIAPLCALQPDYLGFRGALCAKRQRTAPIEHQQVQEVRNMLQKCHLADFRVAA